MAECQICRRSVPRFHRLCANCKLENSQRWQALAKAATIPARVRRAVVDRDGMVCRHCGKAVRFATGRRDRGKDRLSFDHFPLPVSRGGTGTVDNVVVACIECNTRRGDRF